METTLQHKRFEGSRSNDSPESPLSERLAQTQRDLHEVISALALLGIKRCSQCRQFFNSSDPGSLFGNGRLVCYSCVPEWWHSFSGQIDVAEREKLETKLSSCVAEVSRGTDHKRRERQDAWSDSAGVPDRRPLQRVRRVREASARRTLPLLQWIRNCVDRRPQVGRH